MLERVRLWIALLPALIELVRAIEKAIPVVKAGVFKLGLLKQLILEAWRAKQDNDGNLSVEEFLNGVANVVAVLVAGFNEHGWT